MRAAIARISNVRSIALSSEAKRSRNRGYLFSVSYRFRTRFLFHALLALGVFLLTACDEEGGKKSKEAKTKTSAKATPTPAASSTTTTPPPSPPLPPINLQIGAGYNEQIADINNATVARSGARWVRAYVNLSRNYWTFANTFSPPPSPTPSPWPRSAITGLVEGNIVQENSAVSSDADTLAVAALDQLINTKTVFAKGQPVKVILSLKHDFSYPYPSNAKVPPDQFPDAATPAGLAEVQEMVASIENILVTNNRGDSIDILVTGNEPMFEIQPNNDPDTARKYKLYLNYLITALVNLKASQNMLVGNSWDFQIFVGALNSPLDAARATSNVILPAVLEVARDNVNVDGIDLHEHVADTRQVRKDIQYVKHETKLRPIGAQPLQLISTEFSIIQLFEEWMTKPATSGPDLATFLNDTINLAANGTPRTPQAFQAYFFAQTWYPRAWFDEMINAFESEGVLAVTYGIEESPRYPWNLNTLNATATPWVLNGVFNATLLGRSADGYPVLNPLVAPGYQRAVQRSR